MPRPRGPAWERSRLRIHDPKRFAEVLLAGIQREFAGDRQKAAKVLDVPESQISRLLAPAKGKATKAKIITLSTLGRLVPLFPLTWGYDVWEALLSHDAIALARAYERFLLVWERRLGAGMGDRLLRRDAGWIEDREWDPGEEAYRSLEWATPRDHDAQRLIAEMDEAEGQALADFVARMNKRGHFGARVEFAIGRIMEPLLDAPYSGYVERSWREFSKEDRARFLQAGIHREEIMLDRLPHMRRVSDAAAVPPVDFVEVYGKWKKCRKDLLPSQRFRGVAGVNLGGAPVEFEVAGLWRQGHPQARRVPKKKD